MGSLPGLWGRTTWVCVPPDTESGAQVSGAAVRGLAKDLRQVYGHRRAATLVDWRKVAKTLLVRIEEVPASW